MYPTFNPHSVVFYKLLNKFLFYFIVLEYKYCILTYYLKNVQPNFVLYNKINFEFLVTIHYNFWP